MIAAPPRKLIADVSAATGFDKEDVKDVLIAAFEQIKSDAAHGSVMVRGFGTFHTAERAGCVRSSPSDVNRTIVVPTTRRLALRAPADRIEEKIS